MKIGDIANLTVDSYTSDGLGVGKINGEIFFIPYVHKGENVDVKVDYIKKKINYCSVLKINKSSPDRVQPQCKYFGVCGGCDYLNIEYGSQVNIKKDKIINALYRIGHIKIDKIDFICSDNQFRYRNKAFISIGEKNGKIYPGFFKNGSYEVVETDDCKLQDENVFKIAKFICAWMNKNKIKPYNRKTKDGTVKHIFVRKSLYQNLFNVGLIVKKNIKNIEALGEQLKQFKQISSFFISVNNNDKVIIENSYKLIFGDGMLKEKINNKVFNVGVLSFMQVNPFLVGDLYKAAVNSLNLNKSDVLFDMYCGVGAIGICASDFVGKVVGSDVNREAASLAKENVLLNNCCNAYYYCDKSENIIDKIKEKPTALILDPPRSGCDRKLIDWIGKTLPSKIAYISCNPATLARDLNLLVNSGKYRINKVIGCDLFPNTNHVETVCLMSKKEK